MSRRYVSTDPRSTHWRDGVDTFFVVSRLEALAVSLLFMVETLCFFGAVSGSLEIESTFRFLLAMIPISY